MQFLFAIMGLVMAKRGGGSGSGSSGSTGDGTGSQIEERDCEAEDITKGQRTFQTVRLTVYFSILGIIILYAFASYIRSEI